MPKYKNSNDDRIAEFDKPNKRLEALDNWVRLDEPKTEKPAAKKAATPKPAKKAASPKTPTA